MLKKVMLDKLLEFFPASGVQQLQTCESFPALGK